MDCNDWQDERRRDDAVIAGEPRAGTYAFVCSEPRQCQECGEWISPGEVAVEDFVLACLDCVEA
jgi:hypothetical protein